ncbi:MAG: DUF3794 domain-containing protein [Firmicutes bacterium]|nr:DUF3794 domain-containing protein [Bacillota bacterium]
MFEVVYGTKGMRNLEQLTKTQIKVDARLDLKVGVKKILEASSRCYLGEMERTETEVRVSGRVVTRVIYIDETDSFNSEERHDNFSERLILKDGVNASSLSPVAHVIDTRLVDNSNPSAVEVQNIVDVTLLGLVASEIKFVTDLSGDVECKRDRVAVTTFGDMINTRFEVEEVVDIDRACVGILGSDVSASLRDIVVGEGKITLKGVVSANIVGVRSGESTHIYNDVVEFDFSKTITSKIIGLEDMVTGTLMVSNVGVRIENKERVQLVLTAELAFIGHTVVSENLDIVADAFSFTNLLNFGQMDVSGVNVLPQVNTLVDVEGNLTLGEKSPYITKIMSVGASKINSINLVPANDKVTVEGVLQTQIVYECEEKIVHTHLAAVPFSTVVKIDGCSTKHTMQAYASVQFCKVKARRGRELLVDARVSLNLSVSSAVTSVLTSDVVVGDAKITEEGAIMIYTVAQAETLWDVAKRISCRTSEIVAQNPHVEGGLKAGDKLFVYRQQVVNF